MNKKRASILLAALLLMGTIVSGCSSRGPRQAQPYDGKEYIRQSELTPDGENVEQAVANYQYEKNYDSRLSVPTYITKIDDVWFLVDCYHNRVLFTKELGTPIDEWNIMCTQAYYPHTLASDGNVYLIDDTELNRVLVYEKKDGVFINTAVCKNGFLACSVARFAGDEHFLYSQRFSILNI